MPHPLTEVREALRRVKDADKGTLLNGSVRVYYINNNLETRISEALATLDRFIAGQQDEPTPATDPNQFNLPYEG